MPTYNNTITGPEHENAIEGVSVNGRGVVGKSTADYGMRAHSEESAGIRGSSTQGRGVEGWATKSEGVVGVSTTGNGVWGQTEGSGHGVVGSSTGGVGVWGTSVNNEAIHAASTSKTTAALAVYQLAPDSQHPALYAQHAGNLIAAVFDGSIKVNGDVSCPNADCAEDFDVSGLNRMEAGTVVVLGSEGSLSESQQAYDKRVAGVISGAGEYKPAIVLDVRKTSANRQPVALLGKVFCKVDAEFGAIEVGDLLTTSSTPGHAMKAANSAQAPGTVIGKALRSLASGRGQIPILVSLQ
jgi:hypothetical protein